MVGTATAVDVADASVIAARLRMSEPERTGHRARLRHRETHPTREADQEHSRGRLPDHARAQGQALPKQLRLPAGGAPSSAAGGGQPAGRVGPGRCRR